MQYQGNAGSDLHFRNIILTSEEWIQDRVTMQLLNEIEGRESTKPSAAVQESGMEIPDAWSRKWNREV